MEPWGIVMARWWRYLLIAAGSVAVAAPVQLHFDDGSRTDFQLTPSHAFAKSGGGGKGGGGNGGKGGSGNGGSQGNSSGGKGNGGNSGDGKSGKDGSGLGRGAANGSGARSVGQGGRGADASLGRLREAEWSGRTARQAGPVKQRKEARRIRSGPTQRAKAAARSSDTTLGKKGKASVGAGIGRGKRERIDRNHARFASGSPSRSMSDRGNGSRETRSTWSPTGEAAASKIVNDGREPIGALSKPPQAPNSIVVAGLSDQDLAKLGTSGLRVTSQTRGLVTPRIVRLSVPPGMSLVEARRAVERINRKAPADLDTYYYTDEGEPGCADPGCGASTLVGWTPPAVDACGPPPLIGLIDTGIDLDHDALRGQSIELVSISNQPGSSSSLEHGTAIAALLVGRAGSIAPGLIPQATLVAVDAFSRSPGAADRADVVSLVSALEMLIGRGVRVINLSLSGPPNEVLRLAIEAARAQGVVLVAAVGNNGAGAEPSYPAAYPGVIAVTAVDRQLSVYRRATRGSHVAFSAPGVDIRTAQSKAGSTVKSGTSYAVPFVSAAMAMALATNPETDVEELQRRLQEGTQDLGVPGRDITFGYGLVQMTNLCSAPEATPIPIAGHVSSLHFAITNASKHHGAGRCRL